MVRWEEYRSVLLLQDESRLRLQEMKEYFSTAFWNLFMQKQPPEMFYKKFFLKILQYSKQNACAGVSF